MAESADKTNSLDVTSKAATPIFRKVTRQKRKIFLLYVLFACISCILAGLTIITMVLSSSNSKLQNYLNNKEGEIAEIRAKLDDCTEKQGSVSNNARDQRDILVTEQDEVLVKLRPGASGKAFNEMWISLVEVPLEDNPPRFKVIASGGISGKTDFKFDHGDIGATASCRGKYVIRIVEVSPLGATFLVKQIAK